MTTAKSFKQVRAALQYCTENGSLYGAKPSYGGRPCYIRIHADRQRTNIAVAGNLESFLSFAAKTKQHWLAIPKSIGQDVTFLGEWLVPKSSLRPPIRELNQPYFFVQSICIDGLRIQDPVLMDGCYPALDNVLSTDWIMEPRAITSDDTPTDVIYGAIRSSKEDRDCRCTLRNCFGIVSKPSAVVTMIANAVQSDLFEASTALLHLQE